MDYTFDRARTHGHAIRVRVGEWLFFSVFVDGVRVVRKPLLMNLGRPKKHDLRLDGPPVRQVTVVHHRPLFGMLREPRVELVIDGTVLHATPAEH